ncbi:MAG: hypothetical protein QM775_27785 [Pirellulales bacterium]
MRAAVSKPLNYRIAGLSPYHDASATFCGISRRALRCVEGVLRYGHRLSIRAHRSTKSAAKPASATARKSNDDKRPPAPVSNIRLPSGKPFVPAHDGKSWEGWDEHEAANGRYTIPLSITAPCKVVEVDRAGNIIALIDDTMRQDEAEAFIARFNEILGPGSKHRAAIVDYNDQRAEGLLENLELRARIVAPKCHRLTGPACAETLEELNMLVDSMRDVLPNELGDDGADVDCLEKLYRGYALLQEFYFTMLRKVEAAKGGDA